MEKICEFCTVLKPVVYCKADAAFLCLSCDAKVHSANTLSNRHLRTLLCDSCRNRPAYARCLDHRMFVCYRCDQSIHEGSSLHQKRILSSYMGCPSAKDFAALWGFALDEFGQKQQNIDFILQQILDLKKLQLTEMERSSNVMSSLYSNFCVSEQCEDADIADSMLQDSLSLPFSQPENLPGPASAANPLVGESFWQCKSPVQSGQLWSQNMQDLGVCEDILCHDDFNIPDVDITFCNFEELFGTDQDANRTVLDEKDASFSSVEKDKLIGTPHNRNAEKKVGTLCIRDSQPVYMDKDTGPSNQGFTFPGCQDYHQTFQPSYSRFSADRSGTEYFDSELAQFVITAAEVSCHSPDLESLLSEAKEVTMKRYKDKKNRMIEKQMVCSKESRN